MKDKKSLILLFGALLALCMISFGGNVFAEGDPDFDPPLGALGLPPAPVDNDTVAHNVWPSKLDAKQQLGYLTFFDPKLSGDMSSPCSACHDPIQGWGTNEPQSRGYPGTVHWRNSQTVVNNAYLQALFWGGSSPSLEAQAPSAAKAGRAGNSEDDTNEARLRMTPEYVTMFNEVFGSRYPNVRDAWRAQAAFERYLSQIDTPFDNFMNGNKGALSDSAKRGLEVFKGKGNCFECHNGKMFTDEKFYNLGIPRAFGLEEEGLRQINLRWEIYGNKGNAENVYRMLKDDAGAWFRGKQWSDRGKFRTAPLRYTVFTGPYMHHGQMFTLEELIDFYNDGGGENDFTKPWPDGKAGFKGDNGTKTPIMKKLNLSDGEKADLLAFLESLSGKDMRMPIPEVPTIKRVSNWQPVK